MAIAEDRMSTTVVQSAWLAPDERTRTLDEDYEQGPIALNDPSAGLLYQPWGLTWDFASGDFTVTPETTGTPSVVHNAVAVTQCSLAFDQNGHVNVAYTSNQQAYLYWYDTNVAGWVTTQLAIDVVTPTLTLDDKRSTQTNISDILLWYTRQQPDETYNLYKREQRERFLVEDLMAEGVPPYIYKCGLNYGLRVQLGLSDYII